MRPSLPLLPRHGPYTQTESPRLKTLIPSSPPPSPFSPPPSPLRLLPSPSPLLPPLVFVCFCHALHFVLFFANLCMKLRMNCMQLPSITLRLLHMCAAVIGIHSQRRAAMRHSARLQAVLSFGFGV